MYLYVYLCVYVRIYMCMYMHVYVCMCVYVYVCASTLCSTKNNISLRRTAKGLIVCVKKEHKLLELPLKVHPCKWGVCSR